MKVVSRKKYVTTICIIVAVCIAILSVVGVFAFKLYARFGKLIEIDRLVRREYYWQIDENVLLDAMCDGYIQGLGDKYSYYKNQEETDAKSLDIAGKSVGIGVYIVKNPDSENIIITNVMDNSPASKAGIKQFDEIIAVGDKSVEQLKYSGAVSALKCNVGDKINVTVLRGKQKIDFELLCEEFTTQNVYYRTVENIGYIKIVSFDKVTSKQFEIAVDNLLEQDVKGLVFDLQGNLGGTFDSMSQMLDKLVGEGNLITIEYANGITKEACESDKDEIDLPMAVLVDSSSASAAELFAATLRDCKKAILIGKKTYGKCVMQRSYTLNDGTSIRFTIAKCLTKSGYDFNDKGLQPDIEIKLNDRQEKYYYKLADNENPHINAAVDWINKQ